MNKDRRNFCNGAMQGGIGALLLQAAGGARGAQGKPPAPPTSFQDNVLDFWSNKVRAPYEEYVANVQSEGVVAPDAADSIFLFPSETRGLTPADQLTPDDLAGYPKDGDVSIAVHVQKFRPSPADQATLAKLQTGTLRIDVKQVTPMPGLPEALAWTAMATLASRKKGAQVPTLDGNVKFDPGTLWSQWQSIPLTDGLGFWSWNFFMKRREGFWGQLLDHLFGIINTAEPLLPLLGLPGVAVSGLKYIDDILGGIQAQGDSAWMFRGLDIAVCATQKSFSAAGGKGAVKLPLVTGSYVIFPQAKVKALDSSLVVQGGYLVPPGTKPLQTYAAAQQVVPDASYMTLAVSVTPTNSKTPATGGSKP